MPIQFQCGTCAKPIEVDDEVAGRSAQCPFCRSVVQVPDHTTLARPSLHVESGPPPATQRPEPFGLIGLGLALVAYVLLCSGMYMTLKYIPGGFRALQSQPTTQMMSEWQDRAGEDAGVQSAQCGAIATALAALLLSIVGLVRTRRGTNWPAIAGVALAGVFIGVLCSAILFALGRVAAGA